jgi:hypothetical protein
MVNDRSGGSNQFAVNDRSGASSQFMVNDRSGGSSNFMVNETRGSDNFRLDHEKSIGQQNFQVGINTAQSS